MSNEKTEKEKESTNTLRYTTYYWGFRQLPDTEYERLPNVRRMYVMEYEKQAKFPLLP